MTSKISCAKLRKEYRRQNPGILLATAFLFLIEVIFFVMNIQNETAQGTGVTHADILKNVVSAVRPNSAMAAAVTAIAVASAASLLFYLHSRKKEDFYESLPVKRETQFVLLCENALLMFAAPMLIAAVMKGIIVAAAGFFCRKVLGYLLLSAGSYLLIFAAVWLTMALAMIMTGHIVVAFLGFGVFASYFPIVLNNILSGYASAFFQTYMSDTIAESFPWERLFSHLSPVWTGLEMTAFVNWSVQVTLRGMAELLVWIAVLFILCRILYKKRPAEAAGRSMAFPKANAAIRILLVIPAALATGLCFDTIALGTLLIWLVVGGILGTVLFHGFIECIYHFDVHAFFGRKKQLGFSMAAVLFIMAAFWGDLFGYDRYLPKASELKSVLVEVPEIGTDNIYWGKTKDGLTGDAMEKALSMIQETIQSSGKGQDNTSSGSYRYFSTNGIFRVSAFHDISDGIGIEVTYTLKNGTKKCRRYTISSDVARQLYDELFQTRAFKNDLYSLYTADYSTIKETDFSDGIQMETLNLTEEEKKELFDTYLSEFDSLSYETMKNTPPCAMLTLTHTPTGNGSNQEDYYIYSSFTKTIAFLAKKGITIQSVKDLNITSLEVASYDEDTDETHSYTVTDKKLIAGVKDKLIAESLTESSNYVSEYTGVEITATYRIRGGTGSVPCVTDSKTAQKLE